MGEILKQGAGNTGPILLISNGHGEDLLAGVLAQALHRQRPDLELWAFPVVGEGHALRRFPVKIVGVQKRCPLGDGCARAGRPCGKISRQGFCS